MMIYKDMCSGLAQQAPAETGDVIEVLGHNDASYFSLYFEENKSMDIYVLYFLLNKKKC